jgi:hypothetical protein
MFGTKEKLGSLVNFTFSIPKLSQAVIGDNNNDRDDA